MPSQLTAEERTSYCHKATASHPQAQPQGPFGSKKSDMSSLQCVFPVNPARNLGLDFQNQASDTPFLNVSQRLSDKIVIPFKQPRLSSYF